MRTATSLATFAALVLGCAHIVSPAADLFDEIYRRGRAEEAGFRTLTADFAETTVSTLLRDPVVARGHLEAVKPDRLRMEYTSPERKTVVLDGDRLRVRWADGRQEETRDVAEVQKRVRQYFLGASAGDLRRIFEIRASETDDPPGTYLVDMRPKRKALKDGLEDLQIWIDRKTFGLAQMRMVFPGGDSHTVALTSVRINAPVDWRFRAPAIGARFPVLGSAAFEAEGR